MAGAESALAAQRAVNAALMARKQDTEWQLLAALARTGGAPPQPRTLDPDSKSAEWSPARGLAHSSLTPMRAGVGPDGVVGGEVEVGGCGGPARSDAAASVLLVGATSQRAGDACAGCDAL